MTEPQADSPQHLGRYLLGRLRDDEASAVEARYFQDDEYFSRLEVAADDLADRYVRGRLPPDDRQRFERYCLGSRDDRLRLRMAEAMRQCRDQVKSEPQASFVRSLAALFRAQPAGLRFAWAAAGVVLVMGSSVVAFRFVQLTAERTQLAADLAVQRAAAAVAAQQAQQERARRETLESRLANLTTAAFLLIPGLDRGSSADLVVPRDAAFVRFDLVLERPAPPGRYRVTVRNPNRATVWSQDLTVSPERTPVSSLAVTIPSSVLRLGQYEVVLQGIDASGAITEVATYALRTTGG